MNRFRTQQGAALVITLIMLGMVTAMTVVFLGISSRERASVTVVSDQISAKLMAETAAATALAKVAGRMVATQDPLAYGFSVSTNYLNQSGFVPGQVSPANVSYVYPNGRSLTPDDLLINLANLHELARPPVFVDTNALGWRPRNYTAIEDFRFYLDLNRNRAYEPSGLLGVTNWQGRPLVASDGRFATDHFIGDPEWIGQLESPAFAHGPTNRFIGRYAYMILPTGRSLDINHIHNQAREPMNPRLDTPAGRGNQYLYMRNQGVGSWELNMAGFLRQLNPIQWQYFYDWISRPINAKGLDFPRADRWAFSDARDIMMHRYYGSRRNLSGMIPALGLPPSEAPRLGYNLVDDYSDGPLVLNSTPTLDSEDGLRVDPVIAPWPGAENPRRFTDVQQLLSFQPYAEQPQRANNFVSRLRQAMNVQPKSMYTRKRLDSYDRRTYYRLLSQMGVDSEPALRGKLNINYANDWFTGHNTQTNWTADEFINRAAHAMLRASVVSQSATDSATGNTATGYFIGGKVVNPDIGIAGLQHPLFPVPQNQGVFNPTNGVSSGIQLFPANAYTPEVHRLLQVAANIYDATTNQLVYPNPPTVMRPVFRKYANPAGGSGVFISRYTEVTNDWQRIRRQSFMKLANVVRRPQFQFDTDLHINIHGVPWIVGAKKGLPNFNEYSVESIVQVSRRLEVNKGNENNISPSMSRNWRTNQMYTLGITNVFGIEGWNSYTNDYPRRLAMDIRHQYQIGLWDHSVTNKSGVALPRLLTNLVSTPFNKFTRLQNKWRGREFKVPLNAAATTITNSIYSTDLKRFFPANRAFTNVFEAGFAVPDWKLHITNRVQYFLVDLELNRVVDAVNLDNLVTSMDITQLTTGQTGAASSLFGSGNLSEGAFWETNRVDSSEGNRSPTFGVMNQIQVARGQKPVSTAFWRSYNSDPYAGRNKAKAIQDFDDFLRGRNRPRRPSDMIRKQAPFSPTRKIYKRASWQANDPLVHYTVNDLTDPIITDRFSTNNVVYLRPPNTPLPESNLGLINERYRPWGGGGQLTDVNAYNFYAKDPLIVNSDAWQFPDNKFPGIGWLGRVHRGTSWQTMYLKSGVASLTNWWSWSGSFGTHNLMKGFDRDRDGMPDYWETLYGLNPQKQDAYLDPDIDGLVNLQEYRAGTHPLLATSLLGLSTTHPTNDWRLLQLFTTAPNASAATGLLSVNQTNAAAWSAVFSGLTVLSNSLPDSPTLAAYVAEVGTAEEAHLIQPTSPQLDWILNGTHGQQTMWINGRSNVIYGMNQARLAKGGFRTLGDVLSTPTLTEFSPFLNINPMEMALKGVPTEQQKYAIHENVMEWIPQQILSLLKEDEPRITVYAFGQALKPAENSIVTRPGQYYQMCTNYAVVGEVFTKTTYKLEDQWEGTNKVFRAVIEDYQVLAEE